MTRFLSVQIDVLWLNFEECRMLLLLLVALAVVSFFTFMLFVMESD